MPDAPAIPVFMRIGRNEERQVGHLDDPTALPALLRAVADEIEKANAERISGAEHV